jgi:hypothetical protein
MNTFLKSMVVSIVVAFAGLLAGCSPSPTDVANAELMIAAAEKRGVKQGEKNAALQHDAKLSAAKRDMWRLGAEAARQGGYSAPANCNVPLQGVIGSRAAKDFPGHVYEFVRDGCVKEVAVMNDERKANAERAVARAKAREAKLAAKKAKAEQLALKREKRRVAAEGKQPAVKPVAKTASNR